MHTLLLLAALMAQQHPLTTTPCWESRSHPCAATPAPAPVIYTREPRSRLAFWTGLGLVAAGTTLSVLAATSLQTSDGVVGLPCGTDPVVAQGHAIAPCKTNPTVLATGLALAGGGSILMFYGGQTVEVIVAPSVVSSTVAIRLRF